MSNISLKNFLKTFSNYISRLNHRENGKMRLLAISDVTCDYMGSIDFMRHFTTIEKPFFVYQPEEDLIVHDTDTTTHGILYNSIENMPTEFPLDASAHFGSKLLPFMEGILKSDPLKPLKEQGLPPQSQTAVIANQGKLEYLYTYIHKLKEERERLKAKKEKIIPQEKLRKGSVYDVSKQKVRVFKINGHLFDKKIINSVMDFLVGKIYIFDITGL